MKWFNILLIFFIISCATADQPDLEIATTAFIDQETKIVYFYSNNFDKADFCANYISAYRWGDGDAINGSVRWHNWHILHWGCPNSSGEIDTEITGKLRSIENDQLVIEKKMSDGRVYQFLKLN